MTHNPSSQPDDIDPMDTPIEPDLQLLTDYLAGALSPELVADVKRRLDEDPAFREYAAPLIAAWSIPPRWQRHPMSRDKLVRSWDEFTKRAGFIHQRRKARNRRLIIMSSIALVIAAASTLYVANRPNPNPLDIEPDAAVHQDSLVVLHAGAHIRLTPGSRLIESQKRLGPATLLELQGSATFAFDEDSSRASGRGALLRGYVIKTRGAIIALTEGRFTVDTRGDTTDIELLPRAPADPAHPADPAIGPSSMIVSAPLPGGSELGQLMLNEGERARGIRGRAPVMLPPNAPVAAERGGRRQ